MAAARLLQRWSTITCLLLCLSLSPLARADEAPTEEGPRSTSVSWYLYGGVSGDYDDLAAETVPPSMGFGEAGLIDFETTTQLGLGVVYCLGDHFALDSGFAYGTAAMDSSHGIDPATGADSLAIRTDALILEGNFTSRFYPRKCCRLRPWLAAGVRGVSLRLEDLTDEESEDVTTLDVHAGLGLDVQLSDRFDLSFSAEQGLDTGRRAGVRLVFKVGAGGCGRCAKRDDPGPGGAHADDPPDPPEAEDAPPDPDDESEDQDQACGSFLPGQATLPRIETPPMGARRPLHLDPAALPAGAWAFYPALDGDRFFVNFPRRGFAGSDAAELLDEIIVPTLRAVGFEAGAGALRLPPAGGIEVPGADLAALAEALARGAGDLSPALAAETAALIEVLLGERAPDATVDAALEGSLGMTFAKLEADVTRTETWYPFQQMLDGVPIEHTLLLASRRPGEAVTSVRGALIQNYLIANTDGIDSPEATARQAMRQIPGVLDVELPAAGDGPTLVLLPHGSLADGRIELRYAYRMILTARFCQQDLPFLLWLDARDATLLKLEPLVAEAGAEQSAVAEPDTEEPVAARARVYDRDPGIGTTRTYLQVDPARDGSYSLQNARGLKRVDFQDDGFDELEVTIAGDDENSNRALANFDQFPINDETAALCGAGDNKHFQQVHFFSSLTRYRRYALGLGFEPFFSLAWEPGVESTRTACGALSNMSFGACRGYYDAACPDYSDGTSSLDNCMNFAHDNTVIAHEVGHNVSSKLSNWRAFDWCGSKQCALPVGWRSLHDLADFWATLLESTNCVGGWVCKNVGGVDASLGCRNHFEDSGIPRLQELPRPFDPGSPGDHFPEHRRIAAGEYADMQIASAALWELQLGMRSKSRAAGLLPVAPRFTRALRKTGFLGFTPASTDLGIYRYLFELENELAGEWTATAGHLTSKVTAAFARAGLFLVPYQCLDSDPATVDPHSCPGADHGGDAVIDVDDNVAGDDYEIRGVRHPEGDYLKLGGPAPTFHVWTGPLYRFDRAGAASPAPPPCNRRYRVEVSADPGFPATATADSSWIDVPADSGSACYGTWTPSVEHWAGLQTGGAGTRIYYRATTRGAGGDNPRISTAPGNGLWTVPPPYAVLTADGTSRF